MSPKHSKAKKEKKEKEQKKQKKEPSKKSGKTSSDKAPNEPEKQRIHVSETNRQKIFEKIRDADELLHGEIKMPDGFTDRESKKKEIVA